MNGFFGSIFAGLTVLSDDCDDRIIRWLFYGIKVSGTCGQRGTVALFASDHLRGFIFVGFLNFGSEEVQ